jgi:RimJ/RimL family protein N-acetyltransferase
MTDDAALIRSERLDLVLLRAADLAALIDGQTAEVEARHSVRLHEGWLLDYGGLVRFRLNQIGNDPTAEDWLLRLVTRRDDGSTLGIINFHGPPDDRGFAEIGYGLEPWARGQGYAIEAVRAMFDWARGARGVRNFRASIAPDNERSQNLVRKLGLERRGAQWDERDGLEIIWAVENWPDR